MKKDINDFVSIVRNKNEVVKLILNNRNKENIYKLLKEFGFRSSTLDSKRIYFKKDQFDISIINLKQIKHYFINFIENQEYANFPNDIEPSSI